jgi:CheY-like chemotaxis protein
MSMQAWVPLFEAAAPPTEKEVAVYGRCPFDQIRRLFKAAAGRVRFVLAFMDRVVTSALESHKRKGKTRLLNNLEKSKSERGARLQAALRQWTLQKRAKYCKTSKSKTGSMANHSSILLVEDNPRDVELIQRAFKQARMANPIHVVIDGVEAMDYLSGAGIFADRAKYPLPFLVLLDLNLPKVSGLDVLQWLRKQPELNKVCVVILTSSRESNDMESAYALGANSYLSKPGSIEQLVMLMNGLELRWAVIEQSSDIPSV